MLRAAYRMGDGGASVEFPILFPIRTWLTAWCLPGRLGIGICFHVSVVWRALRQARQMGTKKRRLGHSPTSAFLYVQDTGWIYTRW